MEWEKIQQDFSQIIFISRSHMLSKKVTKNNEIFRKLKHLNVNLRFIGTTLKMSSIAQEENSKKTFCENREGG
jgi:hypothetical protein